MWLAVWNPRSPAGLLLLGSKPYLLFPKDLIIIQYISLQRETSSITTSFLADIWRVPSSRHTNSGGYSDGTLLFSTENKYSYSNRPALEHCRGHHKDVHQIDQFDHYALNYMWTIGMAADIVSSCSSQDCTLADGRYHLLSTVWWSAMQWSGAN